jgi:hypothetical protein
MIRALRYSITRCQQRPDTRLGYERSKGEFLSFTYVVTRRYERRIAYPLGA